MSRIFSRLPVLGRVFFGGGIAASGALQLIRNDFVRLVPKLAAGSPSFDFMPRLTGLILVVAGILIVAGKRTRAAAAAVAVLVLVVLALHVPGIASNPRAGFMWTVPSKALALLGGAILLAGIGRSESMRLRMCRVFLAQFLIVAGFQHFVYAGFVHTMVPAWMPMRPFWTYFTGVALLAGGVGLLGQRTARHAGAGAGLMIFLWVLLLHIPRALAVPHVPGEADGACEAVALSGLALLATGGAAFSSQSSSPK